ncbi:Txe/YoeB family addiction module toxin [Nautilia sp.]
MIVFTKSCFENYLYWEQNDKKTFKKINALIKECLRSPFAGRGKPEPLKNELSGFWSRRIDSEHRLVYKYENEGLYIISVRYHYKKGK